MRQERLDAIAARNAAEVERGQQAARKAPGFWQDLADTASQASSLGDAVTLAMQVGDAAWDATCAVGKGAGAVCEAVGRVLPD